MLIKAQVLVLAFLFCCSCLTVGAMASCLSKFKYCDEWDDYDWDALDREAGDDGVETDAHLPTLTESVLNQIFTHADSDDLLALASTSSVMRANVYRYARSFEFHGLLITHCGYQKAQLVLKQLYKEAFESSRLQISDLSKNCVKAVSHLCYEHQNFPSFPLQSIKLMLTDQMDAQKALLLHNCPIDIQLHISFPNIHDILDLMHNKKYKLTNVSIFNYTIKTDEVLALSHALKSENNHYLNQIMISFRKLGRSDITALLGSFRLDLEKLFLFQGELIDEQQMVIIERLIKSENGNLRNLMLCYFRFTFNAFKILTDTLKYRNNRLTHLTLAHNHLDDEEMKMLSSALQSPNSRIQYLHLGYNKFGLNGLRYLCQAFESPNIKIEQLFLFINRIGQLAIQELKTLLMSKYQRIKILFLEKYQLDSAAILALKNALISSKFLTDLNLSGNYIDDEGAYYLAEIMVKSKSISGLKLKTNMIGKNGIIALVEAGMQIEDGGFHYLDISENNRDVDELFKIQMRDRVSNKFDLVL